MLALIADDEATNRILLRRLMLRWGYDVILAEDGSRAWELLNGDQAPRLAVLDWQMPGLDGLEICTRLKGEDSESYVYTVLVTHNTSDEALATGLDAGADDFIRKPFCAEELRSRLGVARRVLEYDAKLKESRSLLETYARDMESLAEDRAEQLVHADRMATLGMLSAGIAHEVNNPATFISGNAQTLQRFWRDIVPIVEGSRSELPDELAHKVAFILEEFPSALTGITNGVTRISKIVSGLKAYARHETQSRERCNVCDCVERARDLCVFPLRKAGVEVDVEVPTGGAHFRGDSQQIEQVLVNLFVNAADAMEGLPNPRIRLWVEVAEGTVAIRVQDCGPGIPEHIREKVFNPFFTTKPAGKGTGLGLSICSRIAGDHKGSLTVENPPGGGARFTLTLPLDANEVAA